MVLKRKCGIRVWPRVQRCPVQRRARPQKKSMRLSDVLRWPAEYTAKAQRIYLRFCLAERVIYLGGAPKTSDNRIHFFWGGNLHLRAPRVLLRGVVPDAACWRLMRHARK